MMTVSYMAVLMEEIALEGLDGITLQALWVRLVSRKEAPIVVDEPMKEFLWKKIQSLKNVEVFLLPKARPDLVLPQLTGCQEVEEVLTVAMHNLHVLYPFSLVDEEKARGSCSVFKTRIKLPRSRYNSLTLKECNEKYGNRFVIVASQEERINALFGSNVIWSDISIQPYCVLECIGRARHYGVYSSGTGSLQDRLNLDPRTLFYVRSKLLQKGIIAKQMHAMKAKSACRSYLFQLSRFYTPFKSSLCLRQEKVLHALLAVPERKMIYQDLCAAIKMDSITFKKLINTMLTSGVVAVQNVTFKELYPSMPIKDTVNKTGAEKTKKIVMLQRDTLEEAKPDDDDLDDEEKDYEGVLDPSKQTLDRTLLYQAFQATEVAGSEGLTQRQIGEHLGLSKLDSRAICKQLAKEGFVSQHIQDEGRQRTTRYTVVNLQGKDYKLDLEKEKFISLTGSAKLLDNLMQNCGKVPQKNVRKNFYDQAIDISTLEDVDMPEPEASASTTAKEQEEPLDVEPPEDLANLSYRALKRVNMILTLILKHKVITDLTMFSKAICEEESKEGYQYLMDRRSLFRLISKMHSAKCINLYKIETWTRVGFKKLTFVCTKDIDQDNSLIQSEIAQLKMRYEPRVDIKETAPQEDTLFGLAAIEKDSPDNKRGLERNKKNKYGMANRFVRLRLMHQLLFYLAYDYTGDDNLDQTFARESLERRNVYLAPECPQIYRAEAMDYRTFISPLPKHEAWPRGWVLLSDVIVRVPLSMFMRLVRPKYIVPGLDDYLVDPVRRNYLIGQLPRQVRADLIGQTRRYICAMSEIVRLLCFMGLLQLGASRQKQKDQQFIFVNTKAIILDTSVTPSRYFTIDPSISYNRHVHHLTSLTDVESYWIDLNSICMATNLGTRSAEDKEEIGMEFLDSKPAMIEACAMVKAEEAPERDVGMLPGDQLGAGGLDSAMFSFMKRNWNSGSLPKDLRLVVQTLKRERPRKVLVHRIEVKPSSSPVAKPKVASGTRVAHRVLKQTIRKARKREVATISPPLIRTKWNPEESFALMLCKVATMFLLDSKVTVPVAESARMLQKLAPRSPKKDAAQCLRKMKNMYSNHGGNKAKMGFYLEEAHQCPRIAAKIAKFSKLHEDTSNSEYPAAVSQLFEEVVMALKEKDFTQSKQAGLIVLPDTLDKFYAAFQLFSVNVKITRKIFNQPTTVDQIRLYTAICLLYSSIAMKPERIKYTMLLLHAFQQFPNELLREAVTWARRAGTVVAAKKFRKTLVPCMTASPYLFSSSFYYKLQNKVPYEVFEEARPMLRSLEEESEVSIKVPKVIGGSVAVLVEGLASGFITASIDTASPSVKLEFEPDMAQKEKDALIKAYELIDECQKKLINFQELDCGEIAAKRPRMESTVIRRADVCLSDDEEDQEDADGAVKIDESSLTAKERIVRENVEARLAFYATRDRMQDSRSVNEKRDRRARLTIAPLPVHCLRTDTPMPTVVAAQPIIDKIQKISMVKRHNPDLQEVLKSYSELGIANAVDLKNATQIFQTISDAKEIGVPYNELKSQFESEGASLSLGMHVQHLASLGVLVRTGASQLQLVMASFSAPWLIESATDGLSVAVRPWVRVDGSLNRGALDRYLGAVLTFLITNPGCTLAALVERFSPAIQPFHVQELAEMLLDLGCVKCLSITEQPFDLFSEPSEVQTAEVCDLNEQPVALEPTVDAITRLTQFIGDKEYETNFLDELKETEVLLF